MDAADAFWTTHLKRDQLFDLVQGRAASPNSVGRDEMLSLSPASGSLVAIWRASSNVNITPFPQIILGDVATLEDLFAWSASYLRGMGPVTAQCRVLTPDIFRRALRPKLENAWTRIAAGAVGAVLGEVFMHTRRVMPLARITLAACRSTLSFALMRATAVGAPLEELAHVAKSWDQVRVQTGQAATIVPSGEIAEAIVRFVAAKLNENGKPDDELGGWFLTFFGEDGVRRALRYVERAFGPLPSGQQLAGFDELTPEARVKALDQLAPAFVSHAARSRSERAFATALSAYLCRAGFPQQASLLAPFVDGLPEGMVWLGSMQGATAFTDMLAEGEGLGWRIARDLFEPPDVFAPPSCDIALLELQTLGRGRAGARMIRALAQARLDVELMPCVSTYVRTVQAEIPDQPALPIAPPTSPPENKSEADFGQISEEMLYDAEKALSVLSRLLRNVRSGPSSGRTGERKRRK